MHKLDSYHAPDKEARWQVLQYNNMQGHTGKTEASCVHHPCNTLLHTALEAICQPAATCRVYEHIQQRVTCSTA